MEKVNEKMLMHIKDILNTKQTNGDIQFQKLIILNGNLTYATNITVDTVRPNVHKYYLLDQKRKNHGLNPRLYIYFELMKREKFACLHMYTHFS